MMRKLSMVCGALVAVGLVAPTGCQTTEPASSPATVTEAKPIEPGKVKIAQRASAEEAADLTYTYDEMLGWMTDLERLARLPAPGVTCKQFSSYDRKSRIDASGRKIDWKANGDFGNYLRKEGDEHVMAEMDGPGCVVRIWSANPMGTLKIYLDGKAEPVLAEDFLKLTTEKIKPFAEPIVGRRSRGANIYLPIPYQKRCKITVSGAKEPHRMYYLVDYWTYKPNTKLPTWSMDLLRRNMDTYKKVCRVLSDPSGGPADLPKLASKTISLGPGAKAELQGQAGPAAIRALKVRLKADDIEHALREVALSIRFDEADEAQVWSPLGDFFGTAPGLNPYKGLPLGMLEDGWMYCYWVMPYKRTATVTLRNDGKQDVSLDVAFATDTVDDADKLMRFHAGWRRSNPNTTFDWPFLECNGRGRFVGVAMFVFNPVKQWWGEGDEKVYVDGETFPSWYGTGSEDYFGYAWCCNETFFHAYHNQPRCDGPGNQNHSSVNRFHIIDSIPFQSSFRMTIENYGNDKDYSCTTYWYATPGSRDFFMPLPVHRRGVAETIKPAPPRKIKGAIEGESLKIVDKQTTGPCDRQDMETFGNTWSGAAQMWFRPGKAGEWVEFELPVAKTGTYKVSVYGTKAIDYGIAQYSVDGKKLGKPINAFHDGVVPTGRIELGTVKLTAPKAKLRLEVVGKDPKSTGFMAGLDCVVLEPVK